MPKSGRERKQKRSARKAVERQMPAHWVPENEREAQANNRLIRESLRWKTDATNKDFSGQDPQELTARELAILITRRNMLSPDGKVANSAVTNLIAMERQNQSDQKPTSDQPNQVHNHLHLHNELKQAHNDQVLTLKQLLLHHK